LAGVLACTAQSEQREGQPGRPPWKEPNPTQAGADAGGAPNDSTPLAGGGSAGDASLGGAAQQAAGDGGAAGANPSAPAGAGGGAEGGGPGALCQEPLLGRAVIEHACLHVEHGPYVDLTAATDEANAPAVSAPHTAYRVGSSGGALSWLHFTAPSSGSYAFLGALPTTLLFSLEDGSLVPSTAMGTTCAGLPAARVLDLDAAQPLSLSWAEGDLVLVVEALAPFGEEAWELGCECRQVGLACASDTDCCSHYCSDGVCESVEPPPCGGKAAVGDPCQAPESCCSGHCVDARCALPLCRSSGPCVSDDECCLFCHDQDHCH
jgi:hypothetical protein